MNAQIKTEPDTVNTLKKNIDNATKEESRLLAELGNLKNTILGKREELEAKHAEAIEIKKEIDTITQKQNFLTSDLKSQSYKKMTNSEELKELEYSIKIDEAVGQRRDFYRGLQTRLVLIQKNLLEEQEYELNLVDAETAVNKIKEVIKSKAFTHHSVALRGLKQEYDKITRMLCEDEINGRAFNLKLSKQQTAMLDDALGKDDMVPYWMKQ